MNDSTKKDPVQEKILSYLISDASSKVTNKLVSLTRTESNQHDLFLSIETFLENLDALKREIRDTQGWTVLRWHELFLRFRTLYSTMGALCTADHWQSPAFDMYGVDEAGDEKEKIIANFNDYKRDQHSVGALWEKTYAREYLTRSFVKTPTAFVTTSGMAALTAACLVVRKRLPLSYRIAVGEHSYFENKELFHMMFPKESIVFFDERHPEALRELRPHAVFVDVLANDPSVAVADMPKLWKALSAIKQHVDVVFDVTCISAVHWKMPVSVIHNARISVICFESLNKFHQYGMDRVTGGVMWSYGILDDALYTARDHAGVMMQESAVAQLPKPNKKVHRLYLARLQNNAMHIARTLASVHGGFTVHYPGLPKDAGYQAAKYGGYAGAFVSLEFTNKNRSMYKKTAAAILREATNRRVPVVAGTSFGLPVTRIYTWSPRSDFERPFLRIAPGLESSEQMKKVSDVLVYALAKKEITRISVPQ